MRAEQARLLHPRSAMKRPTIAGVHLVASTRSGSGLVPGVAALAEEHPTVEIVCAPRPGASDAIIGVDAWSSAADFAAFEASVASSTSDALTICGAPSELTRTAGEVLTRFQRYVDRRNEASESPVFDAVLAAHAALHDVDKPLVKADLDHAIDTWQWMLRLEVHASLAAQLAALFHDIERLESEPDRRIEQHAPDYAAFKETHARRGAERAEEVLRGAGIDPSTASRVRELVASHERRSRDAEVDLLNDADALSFFSLNSPGYADYFGPEQTRKKVAYTLRRLGARARARLDGVRLRADVREHLLFVEAA
ncbi:MAG: hypothetical protein JWP87_1449 [Labilithrix sp.]|nr:hypothetical protein [Labilithrix sp.]